MERHETKHAAINRIGVACAASFAAAILTLSAAPAAAEGCAMNDEGSTPILCGSVTDSSGPMGGVTVEIRDGDNVVGVAETVVCDGSGQPCGTYTFLKYNNFDLPSGTYTLCAVPNGAVCGDSEILTVTKDANGDWFVNTDTSGDPVDSLKVDFTIGSEGEVKDTEAPYNIYGAGTGTPGYWKNHRDAWPAAGVTIGDVQYSIDAAIQLMGKVSKDKSVTMFASLVSAKLNTTLSPLLDNNYDCIAGTLLKADAWMKANPLGDGIDVRASSQEWFDGEPLHSRLDDYNNGKLCAPHRN
jgi:hypothetical protein